MKDEGWCQMNQSGVASWRWEFSLALLLLVGRLTRVTGDKARHVNSLTTSSH